MERWQGKLILGQAEATALAQAKEVVWRTRKLLNSQGWCLWQCSTLGGEVIAVVRDELVEEVPEGYAIYTEVELEELCQDDVSEVTIRLVHEAKKQAGGRVIQEGANEYRTI